MSGTQQEQAEAGTGDGGGAAGGGNARERRERQRFAELMRQNREAQRDIALLRSRLDEAEEAGFKSRAASIDREIEAAEAAVLRTFSDGDPEGHVKAVRQVADLSARKAVEGIRPGVAKPASTAPAPQYTKRTQEWLDANPWYGSDPDATAAAKAADRAAQTKGLVADTPEYWRFVRDQVNAAYPGTVVEPDGFPKDPAGGNGEGGGADHAAADRQDPPAATAAARPNGGGGGGGAPVSRGSMTSRPGGDLRLSPEQLEAAKVAGVTPQQYLASLQDGVKSGAFVPAAGRR